MRLTLTDVRAMIGTLVVLAMFGAGAARAELSPDWISTVPVGSALGAGTQGFVVDELTGISYITGGGGTSSNNDIVTAAFAPDGSLLWSKTFNGPENWHDQARGITMGPGGSVYVVGNTPGPGRYADILLLRYDAASGALLDSIQYASAPFTSEAGYAVATDTEGNVFIAGDTNGDGPDVLVLKFDDAGQLQWTATWDGPAQSPYSQDIAKEILVDPNGDPVVLVHGVMSSLHPDYIVLKFDAETGTKTWQARWGVSGGDYPRDMEIDAAGDIYVTGAGISVNDRLSTIKVRGTDGFVLWQEYDGVDFHNSAQALAIDGEGGVYITGQVDPDGDRSNGNADFYTVKRDAETGAQLWVHRYGDSCRGCGDVPSDIQVDPAGNVLLLGRTSSAPYNGEVILFVLDSSTGLETDRGITNAAGAGILAFDGDFNILNGSQTGNPDTGEKEMNVSKFASLISDLYRMTVTDLVVGADATFAVENATPSRMQFMVFSVQGTGVTPVPQLGITLGIANPRLLASGPADASGAYATTMRIPPRAAGRTVWLQTAENGNTTPVLMRTVP